MIPAQPSRTAWRVALRRAAHQLLDKPQVLDDPVALTILGPRIAAQLWANPAENERGPASAHMRAFLAVRSRFAEDHLAAWRTRGIQQYVVLGAGLDTFAYRIPAGPSLQVWEVDHPATQAWKRKLLDEAHIAIPANVQHVAVDFEHDNLADCLARAGFDINAGAVFAWLGVVPYLTQDAIRATLTYIAKATGNGGGVAFDYPLDRASMTWRQRIMFDLLAARVESVGEPFQSSFVPEQLQRELRALGFAVAEDASPDLLNARYFDHRSDELKVGSLAHMMWAGA
ncbi:MAG TPA: SAM-dependent methyltransferase [Candidatus Acidoferrum sp.]|nr:SAM-dependent methyltransferase [Candidatus Acidoferrum sp.]